MILTNLLNRRRTTGPIQDLPNGGTRVIYNGKVFDLAGRVIRADQLAESSKTVYRYADETPSPDQV